MGLPRIRRISNPSVVSCKSDLSVRAARELVAGYHEAQLAGLLERVADAIDAQRAGTLDITAAFCSWFIRLLAGTSHPSGEDATTSTRSSTRYHRAARELWKFCRSGGVGADIVLLPA